MAKLKRLRAGGAARQAQSIAWGGPIPEAPLAKAKARAERPAREPLPRLARTELLDKATRIRLDDEVDAALKRRPANEGKLAGALRAMAPLSPALRTSLGEATSVLLRRGAHHRELYACGIRALAEAQDKQAASLLRQALATDDAGGSAALSAACFSRDPELAAPLAKLAASRQSHLAFGAELARVARGESNGALLAKLAPMIKESHRIAMCIELFVPLTRAQPLAKEVGPALAVLRGAERHLGRWLVLAEVAVIAGDLSPLQEAELKAASGPQSSRAAWTLVAWALRSTRATARGEPQPPAPTTRPTLELIARLSDRPSADRDTTFLFRMARAGAPSARPMLEGFARTVPLADETSVRAARYLAHDRADLSEALAESATSAKYEELRGMAAAALWDAHGGGEAGGEDVGKRRARAQAIADELLSSRVVGNVAWGALVRAAASPSASNGATNGATAAPAPLLTETPFRWIQWGWLE